MTGTTALLAFLLALSALGYQVGRRRALAMVTSPRELPALPGYYGAYVLLWLLVPSLLTLPVWMVIEPQVIESVVLDSLPDEIQQLPADRLGLYFNDIRNLAMGNVVSTSVDPALRAAADQYDRLASRGAQLRLLVVASLVVLGLVLAARSVRVDLPAMHRVEKAFEVILALASTLAVLTTLGIVLSLFFEAFRFFQKVPVTDFLFGLQWSPQTALRADQVGSTGAFGAIPLVTGTLLISAIAMVVAVPVGLFSAIFLSEYASPRLRNTAKPLLEILAGIPTVVYGFFAALTVAPWLRGVGGAIGLDVASESALAAGAVMGVMIIPFVSSMSDDVIRAVPSGLREASYGLGATQSETIRKVLLPAALPGIVGGILLAVSRAIGETMIVVMAAGLGANLTANPFAAVTTVTVQIVTLLVGDQEFDSAKTLAAFALGLLLFVATLILNVIALYVVRRYQEQYD